MQNYIEQMVKKKKKKTKIVPLCEIMNQYLKYGWLTNDKLMCKNNIQANEKTVNNSPDQTKWRERGKFQAYPFTQCTSWK